MYCISSQYGTYGVEGYSQGDSAGVFGRALNGPGVQGASSGTSVTGGYGGRFTSVNYRGIYVSSSASFFQHHSMLVFLMEIYILQICIKLLM